MQRWVERLKSKFGISSEQTELRKRRQAYEQLSSGEQQLFSAIENGNVSRVRQLLCLRNDVNLANCRIPFNANHFAYYAFVGSCRDNNIEMVETLIDCWPQVLDDVDTIPLIRTLIREQPHVALTILKTRPSLLLKESASFNCTILDSVEHRQKEILISIHSDLSERAQIDSTAEGLSELLTKVSSTINMLSEDVNPRISEAAADALDETFNDKAHCMRLHEQRNRICKSEVVRQRR